MTENEAIKILEERVKLIDKNYKEEAKEYREVLQTAISCMYEIQQYRTIGTVEEVSRFRESNKTLISMYEKLSNRAMTKYNKLKKYEKIGTDKECKEAVRRQQAAAGKGE